MNVITLILSILIAEGAGIIGAVFTVSSVKGWYLTLAKPAWTPPSWVFGPVWMTLYALMGIAAALVWNQKGLPGAKLALWVYGIQLALNALWSVLFFGLKHPGVALVEIMILSVFIIATTVLFWKLNTGAGALMLPYLAWVLFATYLNFAIWRLN